MNDNRGLTCKACGAPLKHLECNGPRGSYELIYYNNDEYEEELEQLRVENKKLRAVCAIAHIMCVDGRVSLSLVTKGRLQKLEDMLEEIILPQEQKETTDEQ